MPNSGKSTLFNAITGQSVLAESYPFCTVNPNIAVVEVNDSRVGLLARMENSRRKVKPAVEFIDIAGLIKGASKGEGLGNQFLDQIRKVDAIVHVIRGFVNPDVSHSEGSLNPLRDLETVELELILKDLDTIEKRFQKKSKIAKSGDKGAIEETELLERLKSFLLEGNLAFNFVRNENEDRIIKELFLLTDKPFVYILNVDEHTNYQDFFSPLKNIAVKRNINLIVLNAKLEEELREIPDEEKGEFLEIYGLERSAVQDLITTVYRVLELITFFTVNQNEARAWSIKRHSSAYEAAGLIHTDMQRGFIKVEVINFEKLKEFSSIKEAKEKNAVEYHGRDYILKEGDVLRFLFKV